MSFNIAFTGAGFILIGALLKNVLLCTQKRKVWIVVLLMCMSLALTVLFAELNTKAREVEFWGCVVMAWAEYGTYLWFVFSGIVGSIFIILLSQLSERVSWLQKYLSQIGKNTLIILAIHFTVMMVFEILGNHFDFFNNMGYLVCATIATALICNWAAEIIKNIIPSFEKGNWPIAMR